MYYHKQKFSELVLARAAEFMTFRYLRHLGLYILDSKRRQLVAQWCSKGFVFTSVREGAGLRPPESPVFLSLQNIFNI